MLLRERKIWAQLKQDKATLDNQRARSEAYTEAIIREQEGLVAAAQQGIKKINSDLKALQIRLKPYIGARPKPISEIYTDLKHRYEYKLGERATLQNAVTMAEESISAAKLHHIPGEDTRA